MPVLSAQVCTTGGQGVKVRPLASVFVEEVPNSNNFYPIGCCMTKLTPPKLGRDSIVDDTCINLQQSCFGGGGQPTCNKPPTTQPGPMNESEFQFTTNYVPGGTICQFIETAVKCGTTYRWMICYANGKRQLLKGWVKGFEPQDLESGSQSIQTDVMVSVSDEWEWQDWQQGPEGGNGGGGET